MTFSEEADPEYMSKVIGMLTAYGSGDFTLADTVAGENLGDLNFLEHTVAMLYAMTDLIARLQGYTVEEALQIYATRIFGGE